MISVAGVSKAFSGEVLYENATFQINPGEKIGLVGKMVLENDFFRMIVGEKPDAGQVSIASGSRVSYFSQKVSEMSGRSVIEVMSGNSDVSKYGAELKVYEEKLCDPELDPDEMNDILEKMGEAQTKFERAGGYEIESNARDGYWACIPVEEQIVWSMIFLADRKCE